MTIRMVSDEVAAQIDRELLSGDIPKFPEVGFGDTALRQFVESDVWKYIEEWCRASMYGDFLCVSNLQISERERERCLGRMDGLRTILEFRQIVREKMSDQAAIAKQQKG